MKNNYISPRGQSKNSVHYLNNLKNLDFEKNQLSIISEKMLYIIMNENSLEKEILNQLFKLNNKIEEYKENRKIDLFSYNIGSLELMSQVLYNLYEKTNVNINDIFNSFTPRFKEIIEVLYRRDTLSHKDLSNELNTTAQNLYNIIHNNYNSSILRVSRGEKRKAVYYSLTYDFRANYRKYKFENNSNTKYFDKFSNYGNEFELDLSKLNNCIERKEKQWKIYVYKEEDGLL